MAKKNTTSQAPVVAANTTTNGANKADAIRQYHAANPTAKPTEIAKALSAQGIEVNASRVSTVLNGGKRRGGVQVETVKAAAAFVKAYGGKLESAVDAIKAVGSFVETCGSADDALAALEAYKELAAAVR
jgi:hypothetical protein